MSDNNLEEDNINLFWNKEIEGQKNTRRGVELCFEKFFVSPKN
jgi:hypothetical protein